MGTLYSIHKWNQAVGSTVSPARPLILKLSPQHLVLLRDPRKQHRTNINGVEEVVRPKKFRGRILPQVGSKPERTGAKEAQHRSEVEREDPDVTWVANNRIWAARDELMVLLQREFEGEVLAHVMIARRPNSCSKHAHRRAKEEGCTDGGASYAAQDIEVIYGWLERGRIDGFMVRGNENRHDLKADDAVPDALVAVQCPAKLEAESTHSECGRTPSVWHGKFNGFVLICVLLPLRRGGLRVWSGRRHGHPKRDEVGREKGHFEQDGCVHRGEI